MKRPKTNIFHLDFQKETECAWQNSRPILRHLVLESEGIASSSLEHQKLITILERLCDKLKLHIVQKLDHRFVPYGKSIVFILSESHLAVHTWPENGYIHIDLVTCAKEEINPQEMVLGFRKIFKPRNTRLLKLKY